MATARGPEPAAIWRSVAALALVLACRDTEPLAPPGPPPPRAYAAVAVACAVEPATRSATCGAPTAPSFAMSPEAASRAASLRAPEVHPGAGSGAGGGAEPWRPVAADAVIGGQGSRLDVSIAVFGMTDRNVTLSFLVRNLLGQPLGSTDGLTADSAGVKLVFDAGPTVVAPQSYVPQPPDTARVLGAATGAFTRAEPQWWLPISWASSQWGEANTQPWPFFVRPGETGQVYGTLVVPTGATRLAFRLLVVAAVPDESVEGLTPDPRGWEQLAIGASHACGIRHGGVLYCWGDNAAGQLGVGTLSGPVSGTLQVGISEAASIGDGFLCAVPKNQGPGNRMRCDGLNTFAQAAGGYYTSGIVFGSSPVEGLVRNVAAGTSHACAVMRDSVGTVTGVSCWGDGSRQQLANGFSGGWLPDTVVAGVDFTCGLRLGDGSVRCWGRNDRGQAGAAGADVSSSDATTLGFSGARGITAGDAFACALGAEGALTCWGDRRAGQLGPACTSSPCQLWGASDYIVVSAGAEHACATTGNVQVRCWGANDGWQAGAYEPDPSGFVDQPLPAPVRTLGLGRSHSCAAVQGGSVYCWGAGRLGALGNGSSSIVPAPIAVPWPIETTALVARGYSTCALSAMSTVCWGRNAEALLSTDGSVRSSAQGVPGTDRYFRVAAGRYHTCALRVSDSAAVCWGEGALGALGTGQEQDETTPTQVSNNVKFAEIVAGDGFTCALAAQDGTPYCWGDNRDGQLGRGFSSRAEPVPYPVAENLWFPAGSVLYAGRGHVCAKREPRGVSAQAYCWGRGDDGQLGNGVRGDVVTAGVVSLTQVKDLALGDRHTCALIDVMGSVSARLSPGPTAARSSRSDPTTTMVRCTGANDVGQLGIAAAPDSGVTTFQDVTSPDPNWGSWEGSGSLAAGATHTCGLTGMNGVFCWGADGLGRFRFPNGPGPFPKLPQYGMGFARQPTSLIGSPFGDLLCASLPGEFSCWGGDNRFGQSSVDSWQRGFVSSGPPPAP